MDAVAEFFIYTLPQILVTVLEKRLLVRVRASLVETRPQGKFVAVKATNIGEVPIPLIGAGLRLASGRDLSFASEPAWRGTTSKFPSLLPPHGHCEVLFDLRDLKRHILELPNGISPVEAWFADATERRFKTRISRRQCAAWLAHAKDR